MKKKLLNRKGILNSIKAIAGKIMIEKKILMNFYVLATFLLI